MSLEGDFFKGVDGDVVVPTDEEQEVLEMIADLAMQHEKDTKMLFRQVENMWPQPIKSIRRLIRAIKNM